MVAALPALIASVRVPEWFAPSNWFRMEKCALSVWADRDGALPDSVNAIVGRVFHAAREEILRRNLVGPTQTASVRAAIDAAKTQEEGCVEGSADPLRVSLVEAYGARRWLQRTIWLEAWARGLPEWRCAPRQSSDSDHIVRGDSFGLGVERTWSSQALRLRGRPDEARLTEDGEIEVTDYKTGFVIGRDGQVSPAVETQLHLYLLMSEILTGRRARGVLHAGVTTAVDWNDEVRERTARRVSEFGDRFGANETVAAAAAATPGVHCAGCRLRPRCDAYLGQAPSWWPNTGDHPRPLPLDVWGRVSAVNEERIGLSIRLEDVAGRRVLVRGLDPAHGLEGVPSGNELFFFDLESTEDRTLHGRRMHPRSLHERSPGPRWHPARRVRVYAEVPVSE